MVVIAAKPVSGAKTTPKVDEPKDKEAEETKSAEESKPEAIPETAVTSDEEAGPSEVKRSPSKKKRISSFNAASFFGKKDKAEEKKEEKKEEKREEKKEEKKEDKKDEEIKDDKPADATVTLAAPAPGSQFESLVPLRAMLILE
jgi:hypothetical protein